MIPARGIVRPAIQAALTALLLACAAWGWLRRTRRPKLASPEEGRAWAERVRRATAELRCGNCPHGGCCQPRSVPPR